MRRMRRLRTPGIREMVAETSLSVTDLIQPIFVDERISEPRAIDSMPGQFRQSLESLATEAAALEDLGVPAVLLFGLPALKDEVGSGAYDPDGVIQKAVRHQGDHQPGGDNRPVPLRVHQSRSLRPDPGREDPERRDAAPIGREWP